MSSVRSPFNIGDRLELMVDRALVASSHGLRHRPVSPRPEEIVLQFDMPWEGPFSGYLTTLYDSHVAEYRLYYRGHWPAAASDGSCQHPFSHQGQCLCVVTSTDGIHWHRPELTLCPIPGAPSNNILLLDCFPHTHNFTPFLDRRPGVPNHERYKALAGGEPEAGLVAYASADGLHWHLLQPDPVIVGEGFDSMNVAFWSSEEQCYAAYVRTWTGQDCTGWRSISRCTSSDFIHWTPLQEMEYEHPGRVHYYTNQTAPYERAPHHYLAYASRFVEHRQVINEQDSNALLIHPRYRSDCSDVVLLTSRGGISYQRAFLDAIIWPQAGPEHWSSRSNYPSLGLLQTAGNQLSLYLNQCYAQPIAHVQRYSFELDRLAFWEASHRSGEIITHPLIFTGSFLRLNLATAAAGWLKVECQNAAGDPLPGFQLCDCEPITTNARSAVVVWRDHADLSRLAGQPIRLRFQMRECRFYALQFTTSSADLPG